MHTVLLHFYEVLEQAKFIWEVQESKEWDEAGNDWQGLWRNLLWGDGNGLGYKVYAFVKTHGMVHLRFVCVILCKFHFKGMKKEL